jgi:hypothetical protein
VSAWGFHSRAKPQSETHCVVHGQQQKKYGFRTINKPFLWILPHIEKTDGRIVIKKISTAMSFGRTINNKKIGSAQNAQ